MAMLRMLFIEGTFSRASEPRTVWNRTPKSNDTGIRAMKPAPDTSKPPIYFGGEDPKIQPRLLVRSDLLRTREQLLEIRPVTDRIPDRVHLESSNGRCPACWD